MMLVARRRRLLLRVKTGGIGQERRLSSSDYVVVGGGSAGCVVASRLAEGGATVTLLEAGDASTLKGPLSVLCRMPTAFAMPMHLKRWNWGFEIAKSPKLKNRVVSCPRGRGLGGSSSINGMVYVRGHALDYENWELDNWRWQDVAGYFKKMENYDGEDESGLRGREGPLHVTVGKNALKTDLFEKFVEAGEKAGYISLLPKDYNGLVQEGFGHMPATIFHSGPRKGERCSAAAAYLEPALKQYPQNLTVITGETVDTVSLSSSDEATGVVCGSGRVVTANKEVILCAGAIATPLILQRSGIGPREILKDAKIPLKIESPGVGRNLQDHMEFYLQFGYDSKTSLAPYLQPLRKLAIGAAWLFSQNNQLSGLGSTNHFEAGAFIRTNAGIEYPDLQLHFLPVAVSYDGVTAPKTKSGHSFQLHVGVNRSRSRGHVAISPSHDQKPTIDFKYMDTEADWIDFRQALRLSRDIVKNMDLPGVYEVSPGTSSTTDDHIDDFLKDHLESAYHPCGTAKMGTSDDAVCDTHGRVRGAEKLRVVDASLFPRIPNGNLNAPVIMTAEKLSDAILGNEPPAVPTQASEGPRGWLHPHWQTRQR